MNDRFLFFKNFKSIADKLPDDMRLKFYDALLAYVFDGIEPEDVMISALITAIKPSLDKEDNRGGAREGAGRPKNEILNNQKNQNNSNEIKNIQNNSNEILNNQKNQSFLETETGNGSKKQETGNNITQSSDKSSDCVARKKLVPIDWFPKLETVDKLSGKGLEVEKVVERFINSCRAKNLKYIDFDRAILAWDWSKDASVQKEKCWF